MPNKYLAFDLGAESGRAILGTLRRDRISLTEIHRFTNSPVMQDGHLRWQADRLLGELQQGLARAAQQGHRDLAALGIDTWGVDFGLLDRHDRLLENPVAYRDARTNGMVARAFELMPAAELYARTGIQIMPINTLYQLLSLVETKAPVLAAAERLLFMPDLFNFLLTGSKAAEYSIASTSQLLDATTKTWAPEIFARLNLPLRLMPPVIRPGTKLGKLLPAFAGATGLHQAEVIACGGHDTACAVAAIPAAVHNWAYISSGTWSLVGVERAQPLLDERGRRFNFTNEGGLNNRIRLLRNTMGLWLLQRCRKDWAAAGERHDYAELVALAARAPAFRSLIDPDAPVFINPDNMPQAIADFCRQTQQAPPEDKGGFVRTILESLAFRYRFIIERLNAVSAEPVAVIHLVGGGSQNELLNQFTADATGLPVLAGPVETTALGNVISQAIACGEIAHFDEGRTLVRNSFPLKEYWPRETERWSEVYHKIEPLLRSSGVNGEPQPNQST
ncbi:MAG: rhamnulokinase [candidate division KSB1 bacterium]|nr:rhamnulokinase [candidate division KSB1 bacterium]MDZ7276281.1 rhamnulokinase [candidate division KSB1 bacterium]MDZ7287913.1 rhamnulokinase [candidate division KSB1 bacterium]MDZ7300074.1 rhamnulokinase [candidate division KSB1 bacterium]MDZ7308149.1 rhamnulokinase [candidate division KSB1 bacterium]